MKNKDVFIFTIAYNCGKVLNKMLESFHEHHDAKIHIFGTHKDFKAALKHNNNEYIELSTDEQVREYFKQGHLGTSYIWTKVLKGEYGNYKKVIQIDSDVIFRDECLSDILNKFDEGYDLVGPRRPYENNKCGRDDVRGLGLPDAVSTYFLGINLEKISNYEFNTLHRMVVGYYNPFGYPIIDFFDPVSFDIIKNGGKMFYLNFKDYGCADEQGNSDNGFPKMNELYDFGNKIIHFAGIGSGQNFVNNGPGNVPTTYVDWAKERYALYMKLFYNEDVGVSFDEEIYETTKKALGDLI
jgi:hypothetical protein